MHLLEIKDLTFSYENIDVLKNFSINISEGESLGVVGSNGAGKTTLFHLICGVLKPTSGTLMLFGKEVMYEKFNRGVGYIFQNPEDQLFSLTVLEDLTFGPLNLGLAKNEAEERALQILSDMELMHLKDRASHHLSQGEKRMISIASVLTLNPEIIILDEPTSSLDCISRRKLINYINKLDKTKIISSHDLEFILETCKNAVIIHDGKIEAKGLSYEIFSNKALMSGCHQEIPISIAKKIN